MSVQDVLVALGRPSRLHGHTDWADHRSCDACVLTRYASVRGSIRHNTRWEKLCDELPVRRRHFLMKRIDKVFVLGAPEREGAVTSRVLTMGEHYPRSTQSSLSSLTALRTRHQDIFKQWREHGSLNEQQANNQKDPPHRDPNFVRQHQEEVEKARSIFDTLTQANQMQRVNEKTTPPSHLGRSTSELEQGLESFHDVLMKMSRQRQQ